MERIDSMTTKGLDVADLPPCHDRPVISRTIGHADGAVDASSLEGTLHRLRWAIAARDESASDAGQAQTFAPGPTSDTVRATDGNVLALPHGWVLLPPGDPVLTRRVKAAGDHWIIWEKKGRKVLSRGVCAAAAIIVRIRAELEAEQASRGHSKRKMAKATICSADVGSPAVEPVLPATR
jgi:hypothetical protein